MPSSVHMVLILPVSSAEYQHCSFSWDFQQLRRDWEWGLQSQTDVGLNSFSRVCHCSSLPSEALAFQDTTVSLHPTSLPFSVSLTGTSASPNL